MNLCNAVMLLWGWCDFKTVPFLLYIPALITLSSTAGIQLLYIKVFFKLAFSCYHFIFKVMCITFPSVKILSCIPSLIYRDKNIMSLTVAIKTFLCLAKHPKQSQGCDCLFGSPMGNPSENPSAIPLK